MNSIEKDFSETLAILTDFKKNPSVLVAFSGGCDSLALLKLCLSALPSENVCALYVNHKIRSNQELENEIDLNKLNCAKLGAKFEVKTVDKEKLLQLSQNIGTEAAARSLRYEILQEYAKENAFDFIATAHHFDDQIETILMKVISKAPITAFRGISEKKGILIRPLLGYRKTELESYISGYGLTYSIDSTNNDNSYKRNEIRNIIIPELRKIMPDFETRLVRLRSYALSQCSSLDYQGGFIDVEYFNGLSVADKYQILYRMWDNQSTSLLPASLVERVIQACERKTFAIESSNGGTFCLHNGKLLLACSEHDSLYSNFKKTINIQEGTIQLADGKKMVLSQSGNSKQLHFCPLNIKGELTVRYTRTGDEIQLKDGTKKVLRLLQDMKIAPVLRNRVPVLCCDGTVIAVFAEHFGGRDRICASLRSSLVSDHLFIYII